MRIIRKNIQSLDDFDDRPSTNIQKNHSQKYVEIHLCNRDFFTRVNTTSMATF